MQSYRIDFTMNHGHEMTLDRDTGIARADLDEIELNMLYSQRIPYLLPVDWLELDGQVSFRYMLTGTKMLLHRLQQQPLTMEQYYMLILGLTDALHECKHYMLRPEGCLLDDQFIFIGEQLHDIRLAYVPMKESRAGQSNGASELLFLVVRFTSYIEDIDGEGLKRVLQTMSGTKWPLTELRSVLLDLIGQQNHSLTDAESIRQADPEERWAVRREHPVGLVDASSSPQPYMQQEQRISFGNKSLVNHSDNIPYIDEQEDEEQDKKRKWIFTSGLVVAAACVWRFIYFEALTRHSLLISAGITLLFLTASILVWRKNTPQQASIVEAQFENEPLVQGPSPLRKLDDWREELAVREERPPKKNTEGGALDPFAEPLYGIAAKPQQPIIEPTVLLGRQHANETEAKQVKWLDRRWEGHDTRVELTDLCFKIGRTGEQVSYVEEANGVSRIHLEIEYRNGEHKAKDLGSKNGSLLNGQVMIPYKGYTLAVGDIIHLAGINGPSYELRSN
ncbi:DUF6382 domain-containing protein [Paenibacillus sp. sgz302251]|uniref:DUF6382 domain-containing protein n=1 Tax=Paenibacillus sp. sgz302251 TaxID=3414493 RepID=UPI003C7B6F72